MEEEELEEALEQVVEVVGAMEEEEESMVGVDEGVGAALGEEEGVDGGVVVAVHTVA